MIKYTDTTVFNVPVQTIVNTVNCVGVMGAGLALECKLRYPEMYDDYVNKCNQKMVKVGKPYVYRDYNHPWIMNFPTKNHWKHPSKLEWIEQGLQYFVNKYETGGVQSVAFPKLGCDKGGLDWNEVKMLIEKYLQPLEIDVYVCLDRETKATGIEGKMVEFLNSDQARSWISELSIRDDIASKILDTLPLSRFRQLLKLQGVGKQTYADLFKFLFSKAVKNQNTVEEETFLKENKDKKVSQNPDIQENILIKENSRKKDLKNDSLNYSFSNENVIKHNEPETYDAFYLILPYIEKLLTTEQKSQDLAELLKVRPVQMKDWLERGVELGKIKKLSKPVRYISTSINKNEEMPLLNLLKTE